MVEDEDQGSRSGTSRFSDVNAKNSRLRRKRSSFNVDQSETHLRADVFETILADWFEEQGVRLAVSLSSSKSSRLKSVVQN